MLEETNFQPCKIIVVIRELKANSAAGPDNFPVILLQNCAMELFVPLYILYMSSMREGRILQTLRTDKITPIYKGAQNLFKRTIDLMP